MRPRSGIDPVELRGATSTARPDDALRPAGAPRRAHRDIWDQVLATGDFDARRAEVAAFNARARRREARPRDHAREVRDLVHPHRLQPGRRARARLQGRLGAREPRRHRDGPGAAHQDAPGRGDGARRAARRCGSRRRAPTRCPTPRPPRPARAPTSTAARSRTRASRSSSGWPRRRAARRDPPRCDSTAGAGAGATWRDGALGELAEVEAYHQRVQLWAAGFYRTEGLHWDTGDAGRAVQVLRLRRRRDRGRGRRLHRGVPHRGGSTSCTTSATRSRPLVDLGQVEGGFVQGAGWLTLEDLRWDESDGPVAVGCSPSRRAPTSCRASARCPRSSTSPARARPRGRRRLRLQGGRRAAAHARVLRARGAARGGGGVRPAGRQRRPRLAGHARGGVLGGRRRAPPADHVVCPGVVRPAGPGRAPAAALRGRPAPGGDGPWTGSTPSSSCADACAPGCSSRSSMVRGHAPREAGAKMVVPPTRPGAASAAATSRRPRSTGRRRDARRRRASPGAATLRLSDKATHRARRAVLRRGHVLLEPLAVVPPSRSSASATSGSSWPGSSAGTTSTCTSSTPGPMLALEPTPAGRCSTMPWRGCVHHSPVPEVVLGAVPAGTHVLVMTHDHAEDFALCDAALHQASKCRRFHQQGACGVGDIRPRTRSDLADPDARSAYRT